MQEVLLRKLIEKSFFKASTEVDALHRGNSFVGAANHKYQGTFTVNSLTTSAKTGGLLLEVISVTDGAKHRITPEQIVSIEGMTPERFAENYMIAPDGTDIKVVGKRRGRRPKNWTPEMENDF